jgi:protein TonB
MLNENRLRLLLFVIVAAVHGILIFFLAFNVSAAPVKAPEIARVMKLTDFAEIPPETYAPPPPPPRTPPQEITSDLPLVESIAETMIETDIVPEQTIVAPGSLITPGTYNVQSWDDYLPIHRVSEPPKFDEREIASALVYPPIAQRSGIEGRVILELFVDRNGMVQQVRILQENPPDRGFGEAAVRAFTGKRAAPALANGEPVSARYRYPVSFRIR